MHKHPPLAWPHFADSNISKKRIHKRICRFERRSDNNGGVVHRSSLHIVQHISKTA